MRLNVVRELSPPTMEFLGSLGMAGIIFYGGYAVIRGTSTPGAFFSFLAALLMLYQPIKSLGAVQNILQEGMAAAPGLRPEGPGTRHPGPGRELSLCRNSPGRSFSKMSSVLMMVARHSRT